MKGIAARQLLALGLLASTLPSLGTGAEAGAASDQELEAVTVTGSRIPKIQTEGPSPVTTITAAQIEARGFTTVQEVANSLTQITGTAQNESQAGSFAQNANALELRGLGPGRTLILVDGRRVADYPMPYDGQSNFVDLSSIPAAAVERVELLAGGASAIYGSDAVAGVFNIVMKKKVDKPLSLGVRQGYTSQGGGASTRVQALAGGSTGDLDVVFAGEIFVRKPIYGYQRKFQDSIYDDPTSNGNPLAARALVRSDPFDLDGDGYYYVDPGQAACAPFSQSTSYAFRHNPAADLSPSDPDYDPTEYGYFCGQYDDPAQSTIRNARSRTSAFLRLGYEIGGVELYSSLSYSGSRDRDDVNYSWFTTSGMGLSDSGFFWDTSSDPIGLGGTVSGMQRFFHPWEIGGNEARRERYDQHSVDYNIGARGSITADWKYDLTLGASSFRLRNYRPQLLTQRLIDYYLGPQDGYIDVGDPGDPFILPVFNPNWQRLYTPMTPALWQQLSQVDEQKAKSSNKIATLVLNGSVLDLPAGPLATAVVVEAASQSYDIAISDALRDGEYFGIVGTGGGGKRDRYAAGIEFSVPVLETLRLQLAGRYDDYHDITKVNGAFTYNAGIEYRPIKQLLIRGSYATSFRAPDMHYVFADPSGFFAETDDVYRCRRDLAPGAPCTIGANPEGARQGNPFLKEETGKSYTFGFVTEPLQGLTFSADYFHIKLDDAVKDDSVELLLETEADCRLGQTRGGTPVDAGSLKCQSALARVHRRPADGSQLAEEITNITTGPINSALLETSGLDLAAGYSLPVGNLGKLSVDAAFSQVFSNKRQEIEGDAVENLKENRSEPRWNSRMSASIGWERGPLSSTVFVQRYGRTWNYAQNAHLPAYVLTNFSARYTGVLGSDAYIGVAIQNLFNRNPPRDSTWSEYPYYSNWNYNPVGREVFFEVGLRM